VTNIVTSGFYLLTYRRGEMSEQPVEPQAETTPTTPETETIKGEPFDAARAMSTIEKLRAEIKELKPKARQAEERLLQPLGHPSLYQYHTFGKNCGIPR
jgi:hypothetical protein